MHDGAGQDEFVEVRPPGFEIYSQGIRDGGCLLYALANAYKALTRNKVTRDKWDAAVTRLADPVTFLTGVGATLLEYAQVVEVIDVMLDSFAEPGERFAVEQLPASASVTEVCQAISEHAVVLFAYRGRTEFLETDNHIVCGVAASDAGRRLHVACSTALWMRHLDHPGYFERRHHDLDRYSNDSISAASPVVIAPNWRWQMTALRS